MSTAESLSRYGVPSGELAMTGPSVSLASGHVPVRGDLAHIRLAGQCFVPHYALPMPHRAEGVDAIVRDAANGAGAELHVLAPGTVFNVLDIAGDWAWGQVEEDGPVGYVPLASLGTPSA